MAMRLSQHVPEEIIPTSLAVSTLTGPQPSGSTTSFILTEKKRKCETFDLTPQQCEDLLKHYLGTNSKFTSLHRSLQRERNRSGSQLPMKSWKPQRALSEEERETLEGPSSHGVKYFVGQRFADGRMTEYRCEAVEERSRQISSFVGKRLEGFGPSFGRILYFVRHRFLGVETDLAYIKWLPRAERDDDTNLFVIDSELPTPPHQPFLPLEDLSHPLVTAVEPTDGQLWILNFDNVLID
ncbi:uncharacterized protein LOC118415047 [Branchiostoma floridae]|uniref:Uncharacterized protein LOC118415047 n=1 Tax=Branchiostoma floridae TaxID=7739 RepID=A0A9J7MQ59_BRAFL|nr:uncharacterized protein LOC118415047 [Branchiostoma floridae]